MIVKRGYLYKMLKMYPFLFILLFSVIIQPGFTQVSYFPPNHGTWEQKPYTELGWCASNIENLYQYLEDQESKAFIVLHDGKIVLEKYFGDFTQDSIWYWASAGKSLAAVLIGIAQHEGYLDINTPSNQYLATHWTSCTEEHEDLITLRHHLSMTTGLDDMVSDLDCTAPSCLTCIKEAGLRWAYHNAPYTLLYKVLEETTKTPVNQYVFKHLTNTIGLQGGYFQIDDSKVFFSNARSMARLGLLVLNDGKWGQDPIIPTSYVHEMTNSSQSINPAYGLLWWLNGKEKFMLPSTQNIFGGPIFPSAPSDMISAIGLNGQIINVVPSQKLVMIRMGNSSQDNPVSLSLNDAMWEYINALPCNNITMHVSKKDEAIEVFPTPANEVLHLKLNKPFSEIEIYDATAKSILKMCCPASIISIDCKHWPTGPYFIKGLAGGRVHTTQILKL